MTAAKPSIGHVCRECINAVFWAHREALERVLDISNTSGEDEAVKRRGMADAAFDCLSRFDLYYEGCLHYKTGTLKDHEVWLAGVARDSFVVLRGLFERIPEPTLAQLRQEGADSAVFDVYARLMKVREVVPNVVVSEKVYRLMDLVGLRGHRLSKAKGTAV